MARTTLIVVFIFISATVNFTVNVNLPKQVALRAEGKMELRVK